MEKSANTTVIVADCTIMQNISICKDYLLSNTLASDGSTTTMTDSRDNTTYTVGKLKDGNIWMLQNLTLVGSKTLTSVDSHVSSNFTLPASSTWSDSYTAAYINSGSINTSDSYGKYGVYYNYCAASAGTMCKSSYSSTTNASYDICPKGWRLPTGGDSGEFQALYTAYSGDYSSFRTAFKLPLSGYYDSSQANYQGSNGYFWSSTYYGSTRMYVLYLDASSVYPTNLSGRFSGFPIRCVAQ